MPRNRKPVPSYLFHKQSGRGRAVWTDADGTPQQQLLPGPFKSEIPSIMIIRSRRNCRRFTAACCR